MEPRAIDRLSQALAHVQPPLEAVRTSQDLRAWADAVIDKAAGQLDAQSSDGSAPEWPPYRGAGARPVCAAGSAGLRAWEQALSQMLVRLRASGSLSSAADITTLGSAFAALVYGGLLLGQASGDATPLRAAMDMALAQVDRLSPS